MDTPALCPQRLKASDWCHASRTKARSSREFSSAQFPHAKKFMDRGFHRILYRFSPDDYREIGTIRNGLQAETGESREVQDGPPEGGEVPDLNPAPPIFAPGVNVEDIAEIANRF